MYCIVLCRVVLELELIIGVCGIMEFEVGFRARQRRGSRWLYGRGWPL